MKEYSVLLVFESFLLDRFLVVEHKERGWELPGGHVEPGESPVEGARREWQEETGLPLARVQRVAEHTRPDGSVGHLFLGAVTDRDGPGGEVKLAGAVDPRGRIVAQRWARRLAEVAPLSFPGDPYRELAQAVVAAMASEPWRLPNGEEPGRFIERVADHPEADPRGDPVKTAF